MNNCMPCLFHSMCLLFRQINETEKKTAKAELKKQENLKASKQMIQEKKEHDDFFNAPVWSYGIRTSKSSYKHQCHRRRRRHRHSSLILHIIFWIFMFRYHYEHTHTHKRNVRWIARLARFVLIIYGMYT